MPYIVVAVALYFLWRYYSDKEKAALGQGQGQGQSGSPAPPVVVWEPVATGASLQPGATYRVSAPDPGPLVMLMLPGELQKRGFVDVSIYKPGDAYPNDWPDSGGSLLRGQATLRPDAQPQALDAIEGVRVWKLTTRQGASGVVDDVIAVVRQHVKRAVRSHVGERQQEIVHPTSYGVYDGLIRRR